MKRISFQNLKRSIPLPLKNILRPHLKSPWDTFENYVWYYETVILKKRIPTYLRPRAHSTKRVVLAGNGPSLLHSGRGKSIDEADVVIRINIFKTQGFEADAGTKTTHWVIVANPSTLKGIGASAGESKEIARKAEKIIAPEFHHHLLIPLLEIPKWKLDSFSDFYREGCALLESIPSTGFIALLYALYFFPDTIIEITGVGSKTALGRGHYFNPDHQHWEGHRFWREASFISLLIKRGILHRLD